MVLAVLVDFCRAASTGVDRQAITLEKDLFTADDTANTYFLYVKVSIDDSTIYGVCCSLVT